MEQTLQKRNSREELVSRQPTPATLLEKAIEKGADITQLKELMDLQERWEKKEAKKSFLDALSLFQTMIPVLKKKRTAKINSQKGAYSYNYADLGSITQEIKKALHECGLSYRWEFAESNDKMRVTCFISHRDGHTEQTTMEAGKDTSGYKNDIQQKGSTQTYLQRYTLIGALGLSTAEDDTDGNFPKKGGQNINPQDEEYLYQWQQSVDNTNSMTELTKLYLKNKRVVESDKSIQAIFKLREAQLKEKGTTIPKTNMP